MLSRAVHVPINTHTQQTSISWQNPTPFGKIRSTSEYPCSQNVCPIPSPASQLIAESTSRTKQPFNSRKGELRNCHVAGQQYYYIWSEATDELRTWRSRVIQIWQVYMRIVLYAETGTWGYPQVADKESRKWGRCLCTNAEHIKRDINVHPELPHCSL